MELYVDGCPRSCDIASDTTLHNALEPIRVENAERNRAIIGLTCDGRDVLTNLLQGMLDEPALSFQRIDVRTGSPARLIAHALTEARETLESAERDRREIINLLGAGKNGDAVILLGSCLGQWLRTNEAISKSLALMGVVGTANEHAWDRLANVLGPVTTRLAEIRDAVKSQDYVSLADILEYEFSEVSSAWQNVIESVLSNLPQEPSRSQTDGGASPPHAQRSQRGEPATSRDPDIHPL